MPDTSRSMSAADAKAGKIDAGTVIKLGSPAKPDPARALMLARMLAGLPYILEAHLPMCWLPSSGEPPALVLVVVVNSIASTREDLNARLANFFSRHLAKAAHMDVWLLTPQDSILHGVRDADCRILERTESGKAVILHPWSMLNRVRLRLSRLWPGT